MAIFFSAAVGGFFDDRVHRPDAMPVDAVEITTELHMALLHAQSEGAEIVAGSDGAPAARLPEAPTLAERKNAIVRQIKREAQRRIERIAPLWKQLNALRDSSAVDWAAVDAIRAASDLLEQQIAGTDETALASIDPTDDTHWPSSN